MFPFQLGILAALTLLGLIAGSVAERRHYESIKKREAFSRKLAVVTFRSHEDQRPVRRAALVTGSAVISLDYFKRIVAGLRGIIGGSVTSYETLVDRARREAVLRMKEEAKGSSIILNCRIETSNIASRSSDDSVGSVEALAYGTAVWYED